VTGPLVSRGFFDEVGNALPVMTALDKYTRHRERRAMTDRSGDGVDCTLVAFPRFRNRPKGVCLHLTLVVLGSV
jgi:hypothetical protein